MPAVDQQRLFFALWPDDLCRERMVREAKKLHEVFGGRITRRESIHMTLVFLGEISADQAQAMHATGERTRMQSFSLHMAGAGCWAHNRIAWLAPAVTPEPLARLVKDLRRNARDAGIVIERRPFTPHVSLLRNAQCRPVETKIPLFEWRVQDFVLVRSRRDAGTSHYEILARWPADGIT
ncbi:MAG: RNA 2',3'-cyclic phosphodiesterase [Betaproteobacteria bacterium]|nr:RNA 2',3'-cyclic phosphodiesterase [Betaproteobacteria bacterium]